MKKIIKEDLPLERFELPRAEAIALMKEKDEPYKVELIEDLPEDAVISFYKQGEFTDLCAGPHLMTTKEIGKAFKLTCTLQALTGAAVKKTRCSQGSMALPYHKGSGSGGLSDHDGGGQRSVTTESWASELGLFTAA